jgi:hypothetical protein
MAKKERNCYTITTGVQTAKHPVFGAVVEIFAYDVVKAAKLLKEEFPKCGEIISIREGRMA